MEREGEREREREKERERKERERKRERHFHRTCWTFHSIECAVSLRCKSYLCVRAQVCVVVCEKGGKI